MRDLFFTGFAVFTLLCAVGVVFARSAIYSAFSLVLCFFGLAGLYLLWDATFLSMIQILIYTGAIVVLFVFVTMLLYLDKTLGPQWHGWLAMIVGGSAVWTLTYLLLKSLNSFTIATPTTVADTSFRNISKLLFTQYLWPFEVLSIFLLVMMIAIYILARPEEKDAHEEIKL